MKNTITLFCCLFFACVQAQEVKVWFDTTQMKHVYFDTEPIAGNIKIYNGTMRDIYIRGGSTLLTSFKGRVELLDPEVFGGCGTSEESYEDCVKKKKEYYTWNKALEDTVFLFEPCLASVYVKPGMTATMSGVHFNMISNNYSVGRYDFVLPVGEYLFYPIVSLSDGNRFLVKQPWYFSVIKGSKTSMDAILAIESFKYNYDTEIHSKGAIKIGFYPYGANKFVFDYLDTCKNTFFSDKAATYLNESHIKNQSDLDLYTDCLNKIKDQNLLFDRLDKLIEYLRISNNSNWGNTIPSRYNCYAQLLKMLRKKDKILAEGFFLDLYIKEYKSKCKIVQYPRGKEYLLTDAQLTELEALCK